MYCKNCGKPLGGDEKFCSNCGTKVEYDTDVKSANDIQDVEEKSSPKNNMLWDLGDFEDKEKNEDSKLSWNTDGLFMESGASKESNVKDNYKGPLMFRTDDKAPSREEIKQREKEEETTKKSSLYTDETGLGKGNRWDISNVEIPMAKMDEPEENSGFNWSLDEEDTGVNLRDKAANGFKSIGQLNAQSENKVEINDNIVADNKLVESIDVENKAKEELQAVIDGAIEKAEFENGNPNYGKIEEKAKPVVRDKKERIQPSEFSWSLGDDEEDEFPPIIASPKNPLEIKLKINQPEPMEMKYDDMDSHKAEPSEIDFNREMITIEPGWKDVVREEQPKSTVQRQSEVVFDWSKDVELTDYHPGVRSEDNQRNEEVVENLIDDVIDNNMSMTLEELAAGNIETDNVPESNYDESRKTIRNVLSKNAKSQEPNFKNIQFSSDELENTLSKVEEEQNMVQKAENESTKEANCKSSRVIDIEQPKISNISLEIQEDEVTGEKVEKVLADEPKAPAECLKTIDNIGDCILEDENSVTGFTRKEINEDIRVAQIGETSVMDEVIPSAVDVIKSAEDTNLDEHVEENDKERFYTFNKNKEEFQKLLDQEYKRLEGNSGEDKGYEEDIESFMSIQKGKSVEATSQIEEMNKARSVFINGPSYDSVNVYEDDDFKEENISINMDEFDGIAEEEGLEKLDGVQVIRDLENKKHEEPMTDGLKDVNIAGTKESVGADDTVVEKDEEEPVVVVFEPQKDESLVDTFIENEQAKGKAMGDTADEKQLDDDSVGRKFRREKRYEKKRDKKHNPKADTMTDLEVDEENADYLNGSVSKMIIDPTMNSETEKLANEFFEEDDDDQRKGGAKRVILGIIGVIIVLIIAVLGITIILPDSPVAQVMNDMGHKVVTAVTDVFGGNDDKDKDKIDVRESALEDKTKLIQAEIDRNYKNNIEEIVYNSELAYDNEATYDLKDLKDAKNIQTVLWYEDENGKPHYYDQEITGTIIELVSMRSAWINKSDKSIFSILNTGTSEYNKVEALEKNNKEQLVEMLSIGDIKVAGNAYYVWTAETVAGETTGHIYEIKEQDQKLYVNDHCDI